MLEFSGYDGEDVTPQSAKKVLAADVWRLMLDCSLGQFGRTSGILQRLGLTPGHMKLMMQLEAGEGRPMGSLAQTFQCDASTMTWLVDRLEERGLVERRMLPSDRRVKTVALTPVGVKTKAELMEKLYEPPDELLKIDRAALEDVRTALTQLRASAPPPFASPPATEPATSRRRETA